MAPADDVAYDAAADAVADGVAKVGLDDAVGRDDARDFDFVVFGYECDDDEDDYLAPADHVADGVAYDAADDVAEAGRDDARDFDFVVFGYECDDDEADFLDESCIKDQCEDDEDALKPGSVGMDSRNEEELVIQIPPHDGSQTERTRGTFGGRQRWISGGNGSVSGAPSDMKATAAASLVSPRRMGPKTKVTAPSVQSFLSSMGILVGEETHIVDKEVNEIAILRREYDTIKNANAKKEAEIRLYETKLDEEMADRGVYNHMIQRLTAEALTAKKITLEKEKQLEVLKQELTTSTAALLAARQEKTAAENVYKKLYQDWWEKKQEKIHALDDMQQAVEQTRLKFEILEQREVSRKKHVQDAIGEMKMKESRRLRHESNAQIAHFSVIQEELSDTDVKLLAVETEFKRIMEAAGTNDVDKIIAKFLSRDDTLRALKEEHAVADARMRKLKERHKQLNETLGALRGSAINSRTIYQEMDQTAERLKDIEKDAATLSEKFNRTNVMMDAFRACMLKCLTKLSTEAGAKSNAGIRRPQHVNASSTLDTNGSSSNGHFEDESGYGNGGAMSSGNSGGGAGGGNGSHEITIDDDVVIDRTMRKKLVGLIINRGRRGKKVATPQQTQH
ncbi:hypothetical protein P43SY_004944 [Pythium insidiosum]|uniref:Uncharacterized protein n=1 Tax=Pythium insidiosum TaxID=114742 RepID=A0AAD5LTM6_PYTIN|nr:hypothetical protein P43SY_004944 [Pythium insidiosum]